MATNDGDRFDLTGKIVIRGRAPEFIGSYSVVYRGQWAENTVAVKIIRPVGALSTMRRKVRRERVIWESLEHPNILPFYGHADDEDFQPFGAFISPWCLNGDVGRFLEQHGGEMETPARVLLWIGVLNGVAFLHSRKPIIVHGDLKPGNILIDDNRNPRICDFGLSRIIQEGGTGGMTTTTEHTGTERYLASELVTNNLPTPTTQSDIYALGCLGLEFIYLERPYAHRQNNHHGCIITDIREGIPPANRQDDVHSPMDVWWGSLCSWNLLEALWSPNPAGRPAASFVILVTSTNGPDNAHMTGGVPVWHHDTRKDGRGRSKSHQERDERITRHLRTIHAVPGILSDNFVLDHPESSQQYASSSRQLHSSPVAAVDAGARRFLSLRLPQRSSPSTSPTPSPPSSPYTSPIPSPPSPYTSPIPSPIPSPSSSLGSLSLSPSTSPSQGYPFHPHDLQTNFFTPNPPLLAGHGAAPNERRTDRPLRRTRENIVSTLGPPITLPPPNVRSSSSSQFTSRGYPEGVQRTVENWSQTPQDGKARRTPKSKGGTLYYSGIMGGLSDSVSVKQEENSFPRRPPHLSRFTG